VYTQLVDGRRDLQQKSSMKNPFVIQRATRKRPAQAFKSSEDLAEKSSPMNFMVRLRPVVFIGILLVVWHIAVAYQKVHLLPTPLAVARGIVELAQRGLLLKYVVASLFRVTWGFTGAAILAIPFGLALGWNRRSEIALNPLIQILRPISPLAWIPMSILWFGVGDMAAIFLIFLASFLPLTVTAVNAVAGIPAVHINAGRNFGLSPSQLVYRVLCPAVVPQLIIGLRITLGIAWLVVVAAEMIAVNSGLGFLIVDARNAGNRYDLVVAGMVMIGSIGFLLDIGMRSLEKSKPLRWGYSEE
jgi:NitT/TauT family transport system permease protein